MTSSASRLSRAWSWRFLLVVAMRSVATRRTWRLRSPLRTKRVRGLLQLLTLVLTCISVMLPTEANATPPTSEPEPTTTTSTTSSTVAPPTSLDLASCSPDVTPELLARCQLAVTDEANAWIVTALWVMVALLAGHLILYTLRGR